MLLQNFACGFEREYFQFCLQWFFEHIRCWNLLPFLLSMTHEINNIIPHGSVAPHINSTSGLCRPSHSWLVLDIWLFGPTHTTSRKRVVWLWPHSNGQESQSLFTSQFQTNQKKDSWGCEAIYFLFSYKKDVNPTPLRFKRKA